MKIFGCDRFMRGVRCRQLLLFFLLIQLTVTRMAHADTRFMLIGNSITDGVGSASTRGFRDLLYDRLAASGVLVDFTGSSGVTPYSGHFKRGALIADFYSGTYGNGSFNIRNDLEIYQPQILMIHLGTNDINQGALITPYTADSCSTFTNTVSGRLADFLSWLMEQNPSGGFEIVYLAKIIPKSVYHDEVIAYNDEIARIVSDADAGLIPAIPPGVLRMMDAYTDFDVTTMQGEDHIHPNDAGYEFLSDVYYSALQKLPIVFARISADTLRGGPNMAMDDPIVVRLADGYGNGIPNEEVTFAVRNGEATILHEAVVTTDDSGYAYCWVRLGNEAVSTVTASTGGLVNGEHLFTLNMVESVEIAGSVHYYNNESPVPDVELLWKESPGIFDSTNQEGSYRINSLPYGSKVTLNPSRQSDGNGPNRPIAFDAALTARHALGIEVLTDQAKTAADADRDGKITLFDAVQIARAASGYDVPENIHVGRWRFSPDSLFYDHVTDDLANQNFSALLVGDVHGGWTNESVAKRSDPGGESIVIESPVASGNRLMIPVVFSGDSVLSGNLECTLLSGRLTLSDVLIKQGSGSWNLQFREDNGHVRIAWYGSEYSYAPVRMHLIFDKDSFSNNAEIQFSNQYVNASALPDQLLEIDGTASSEKPAVFALSNNYPNPFNGWTCFTYQIPQKSHVRLSVYNSIGQLVHLLVNRRMEAGTYDAEWNGTDSRGIQAPSGIYMIELSDGVHRGVRKIQYLK